ncbi:unnamed protein product [Amoebophrya sp. A25]|nr:unnamed protein product [Amoebophrya sp. A25]|eukprot:GSA25T00027253001.1
MVLKKLYAVALVVAITRVATANKEAKRRGHLLRGTNEKAARKRKRSASSASSSSSLEVQISSAAGNQEDQDSGNYNVRILPPTPLDGATSAALARGKEIEERQAEEEQLQQQVQDDSSPRQSSEDTAKEPAVVDETKGNAGDGAPEDHHTRITDSAEDEDEQGEDHSDGAAVEGQEERLEVDITQKVHDQSSKKNLVAELAKIGEEQLSEEQTKKPVVEPSRKQEEQTEEEQDSSSFVSSSFGAASDLTKLMREPHVSPGSIPGTIIITNLPGRFTEQAKRLVQQKLCPIVIAEGENESHVEKAYEAYTAIKKTFVDLVVQADSDPSEAPATETEGGEASTTPEGATQQMKDGTSKEVLKEGTSSQSSDPTSASSATTGSAVVDPSLTTSPPSTTTTNADPAECRVDELLEDEREDLSKLVLKIVYGKSSDRMWTQGELDDLQDVLADELSGGAASKRAGEGGSGEGGGMSGIFHGLRPGDCVLTGSNHLYQVLTRPPPGSNFVPVRCYGLHNADSNGVGFCHDDQPKADRLNPHKPLSYQFPLHRRWRQFSYPSQHTNRRGFHPNAGAGYPPSSGGAAVNPSGRSTRAGSLAEIPSLLELSEASNLVDEEEASFPSSTMMGLKRTSAAHEPHQMSSSSPLAGNQHDHRRTLEHALLHPPITAMWNAFRPILIPRQRIAKRVRSCRRALDKQKKKQKGTSVSPTLLGNGVGTFSTAPVSDRKMGNQGGTNGGAQLNGTHAGGGASLLEDEYALERVSDGGALWQVLESGKNFFWYLQDAYANALK